MTFFNDDPGFEFARAARGPTCFIHIGMRKTSTTSIQSALQKHTAALTAAGFHYAQGMNNNQYEIGLAIGARRKMLEYGPYFGNRFDTLERDAPAIFQAALDDWTRNGGDRDLILSAEDLSKIERPHIETLKTLLSGRFETFRIVCLLRRQIDYAVSNLSTMARNGSGTDALQIAFSPESDRYYRLDYEALLADWASVFGHDALIVETYEAASAAPGGSVRRFFDLIGAYDFPAPTNAPRENPALSAAAVGLLLSLNQVGFGSAPEGYGALRYRLLTLVESELQGSSWTAGAELTRIYETRFQASNEQVARTYFGDRPGPLFPPRDAAPAGPPIELMPPALSAGTARIIAKAFAAAP